MRERQLYIYVYSYTCGSIHLESATTPISNRSTASNGCTSAEDSRAQTCNVPLVRYATDAELRRKDASAHDTGEDTRKGEDDFAAAGIDDRHCFVEHKYVVYVVRARNDTFERGDQLDFWPATQ